MEVVRSKDELMQGIEKIKIMPTAVVLLMVCIILAFVGKWNFLLFHTLTEMFCLFIGVGFSIIAYNSYNITKDKFFLYVSTVSIFVNVFHLLHILTFNGVDIFPWNDTNTSIQFSLVYKYFECLVVIAPFSIFKNKRNFKFIMLFYVMLSASIILSIFYFRVFPVCLDVWLSPTAFKMFSEYLIAAVLLIIFILFFKSRKVFLPDIIPFIAAYISLKIPAQILFALYDHVHDMSNVIAHLLRFLSFNIIFMGILKTGFIAPIKNLFRRLEETNSELKQKSAELELANKQLKKEIADCIRAEDMLRKSEERYRLLIEFIPDAIIVHNDEKILFANQAGIRLFGAESLDHLTKYSPNNFLHQREKDVLKECVHKIRNNGNKPLVFEKKVKRRDESDVEVEVKTIPYPFEEHSGYLSVIRDITQRRQVEDLKKSVDENTNLLKEAAELDKIKTDFFTDISHEFRTPISVMLCTLQVIEAGVRGNIDILNDNEKMTKYVSIMKQNLKKLLKRVNNLLDISKIDSGNLDLKLQNCNIAKMVEEVCLSVYEYTKNKDLCLMFDSEVDTKVTACDVEKIERVILNLLSNAIKFTNRGGRIEINVYEKGKNIVISVKDTGIGIPEDKLELIFERFKQVDNSLVRDCESTGIGLSLVKSLVELHGGSVYVESEIGVGSTFYVELPVRVLPDNNENGKFDSRCDKDYKDELNIELSDLL